ncbi:testis-specific serine/threonine-protein kinase 5-like isoform X2 [Clupea harengus]|nr:testis-specific serine/threonine-protein kinase 5-like isoform X2 [Clupea harengus]
MFHTLKRVYLVLELALRGDLLEHINTVSQNKGSPGLSEDEARRIFQQIVSAVKHCHSSHIVHRDLKCENILLDEGGFVKLTDFGFANSYSDKNVLMSTFCGSVAYTAPEILMSHKYNGEMADLWSLGVILYAIVTGKLPYKEKHPRKLVQLLRKELPFHTPVSTACQDLITRLLQWQPSARLSLDQICCHHWMSPPTTGLTKLRATKSYITDGSKTPENKFRDASPKAKTSHAFQLRPGTPISTTTPFTRSNTTLAEGPQRVLGGRRSGANSADSRRILPKQEDRREELTRPMVDQASNPNQLFFTRPRPPTMPKPFHNLPNFRKPGSMAQELRNQKQLYRLTDRLPENKRPPRIPMKIPTTGF